MGFVGRNTFIKHKKDCNVNKDRSMKILIAKESIGGEASFRNPSSVAKLIKLGYEVLVLNGAGHTSFTDEQFENAGATIIPTTSWDNADIILKYGGSPEKKR